MKRLGRVSPHPNALGALFTYTSYDYSTNIDTTILSWVSFTDYKIIQLSTQVHGQFWFTDTMIGFLKDVNGTNQVCKQYHDEIDFLFLFQSSL